MASLQVNSHINKPYHSVSETDYKSTLRGAGIEVVDLGKNYLYIDHVRRAVYSEEDLGKAFLKANLTAVFVEKSQLLPQSQLKEQPAASQIVTRKAKQEPLDKPTTHNTLSTLTEAERTKLGKLVSKQFQQFKKDKEIFYESQLIKRFPFNELVALVRKDGTSQHKAILAVTQFEEYKRKQLPEIQIREESYFKQTTQAYLNLAIQMPIGYDNRLAFLRRVGLEVVNAPNGNTLLQSPHSKDYNYTLTSAEQTQLLTVNQPDTVRTVENNPQQNLFPYELTKAEKTLYKALANGEPINTLSYLDVNARRLQILLPQPLYVQACSDLNKNYLNTVQNTQERPLQQLKPTDLVQYYFRQGIVFEKEKGARPGQARPGVARPGQADTGVTIKAGYALAPKESFLPVEEPLKSQLASAQFPPNYEQLTPLLNTPPGLAFIRYNQLLGAPESAGKQREIQKMTERLVKDFPNLKGLTSQALSERLGEELNKLAQRGGIRIKPSSGEPADKTEREAIYKLLSNTLTSIRFQQDARYESSYLMIPANFPDTVLTNKLQEVRGDLLPLQAKAYVDWFKQTRIDQLATTRHRDQNQFQTLNTGLLTLLGQAPITARDRITLLNRFGVDVFRDGDTYRFVEKQPKTCSIKPLTMELNQQQVKQLLNEPKNPQKVSIPATTFLADERKIYSSAALNKPVELTSTKGGGITTADVQLNRLAILLPPQTLNPLTEKLNQNSVNKLITDISEPFKKDQPLTGKGLADLQKTVQDQLFQRGFVILGSKETGYVAGHYLSNTKTFRPIDARLVEPGSGTLSAYTKQCEQLNSASGKLMTSLADALDSGSKGRIDFAIQSAIRQQPGLAMYEPSPYRLLGELNLATLNHRIEVADQLSTAPGEDHLGKAIDAGMNTQHAILKKKKVGTPAIRRRLRR